MDADFTLKNAGKRLTHLKNAIEGKEEVELDRITSYRDPRNVGVVRQDLPNPLKYISPEVGAIAAELRAVLDQTLYAVIESYGPLLPKQRPHFPICQSPNDFRGRIRQDLKGIPIPGIAFIGRLQPYRGNNWLGELKGLADSHKHRNNVYLRATNVRLHASALHPQTDTEHFLMLPASRVHVPKSMQVNARFSADVTLEDGRPIIEVLEILHAQVGSLLQLLKARFKLT